MRIPIRKPGKYTHYKIDPYLTPAKLQACQDELHKLIKTIRPGLIEEVKRLSELGDFSENAEYQIAKGRLRGANERISTLEQAIKRAVVIDPKNNSGTVQIGSKVTVVMFGQEKVYQILGSTEADPAHGIISFTSPLGASLMGKSAGQTFEAMLGQREVKCQIIKIE